MKLTDTDSMPWGQHAGEPMQDVPVGYLHFAWHKLGKKHEQFDPVAIYIRENLEALRKEDGDLLWD